MTATNSRTSPQPWPARPRGHRGRALVKMMFWVLLALTAPPVGLILAGVAPSWLGDAALALSLLVGLFLLVPAVDIAREQGMVRDHNTLVAPQPTPTTREKFRVWGSLLLGTLLGCLAALVFSGYPHWLRRKLEEPPS